MPKRRKTAIKDILSADQKDLQDFASEDAYFRERFMSTVGRPGDLTYEQAKPLYQLGFLASRNRAYSGRSFNEIEPELSRAWTADLRAQYGDWKDVRDFAAEAFERGTERVITRSEEEVGIQKRPTAEGEVQLRKTVETEHRTDTGPVSREESSVERRPVKGSGDDDERRPRR